MESHRGIVWFVRPIDDNGIGAGASVAEENNH